MVKVYTAKAMTGRTGKELIHESLLVEMAATGYRVQLLDPVEEEKITATDKPVRASLKKLQKFWRRDKEMIRHAHVLLDVSGPKKSEGVAHEIGYARFALWKPVVRVWPGLKSSVAHIEDDVVVEDLSEAFYEINKRWGTPWKRFVWRAKLINRCLPRWLWHQLGEWF